MKVIATFDIGTTNVKGVLTDLEGSPLVSHSLGITTHFRGPEKNLPEQDARDWYRAFCAISRRFFETCAPEDIIGIVLSGQMQDVILLDDRGETVMDAILYSDGRAEDEAREILQVLGKEQIEKVTANAFDGSRPLAKLKWVQKNLPQEYRDAAHILISSKDYVISKLTGEMVSDVVSCSTAGLMDIGTKRWRDDWLKAIGMDHVKWPDIRYPHEPAGSVLPNRQEETGYRAGTPVYTGTGDAGSATLAGGISSDGEFNINLGTSGWVACTSNKPLHRDGVSNLAAMPENVYINVVPFFNAGNVHRWAADLLADGASGDERYAHFDMLLKQSRPASGGLLFLPYIVGERFPVMDNDIAGCFVDVRADTVRADMARAALEGVAYSIRQGVEAIGKKPVKFSLVGGGARSDTWCRILADMLKMPVHVFKHAEYLPAMAIASSVLIHQGYIKDYQHFMARVAQLDNTVVYAPDAEASRLYDRLYPRFCSIYPAVKTLASRG